MLFKEYSFFLVFQFSPAATLISLFLLNWPSSLLNLFCNQEACSIVLYYLYLKICLFNYHICTHQYLQNNEIQGMKSNKFKFNCSTYSEVLARPYSAFKMKNNDKNSFAFYGCNDFLS